MKTSVSSTRNARDLIDDLDQAYVDAIVAERAAYDAAYPSRSRVSTGTPAPRACVEATATLMRLHAKMLRAGRADQCRHLSAVFA